MRRRHLSLALLLTFIAIGCEKDDDDDTSSGGGSAPAPAPIQPGPSPVRTPTPAPGATPQPTPGVTPTPAPGTTPSPVPTPAPSPSPSEMSESCRVVATGHTWDGSAFSIDFTYQRTGDNFLVSAPGSVLIDYATGSSALFTATGAGRADPSQTPRRFAALVLELDPGEDQMAVTIDPNAHVITDMSHAQLGEFRDWEDSMTCQ